MNLNRRDVMIAAAGAAALSAAPAGVQKPAVLGGTPVRSTPFPAWPVSDETEERALLGVLRSGKWGRGNGREVGRFEQEYAQLTGARHCLASANGTSALLIGLHALGVQPGDEVIVPPYTFVATVNAVLAMGALPVFADSDIETFQIDPDKIERAITSRTVAIIPVHLGGSSADLDRILAISRVRNIPVLEDACQAHLAEWKGRKVGTYGKAGCFSFQASKNLNSGEGGAVLTNDADIAEKCYAFHNNSRGRNTAGNDFSYRDRGLNLRLTEFQAGLLLSQMTRLQLQSDIRDKNAGYLSSMLREIPGISPARMYPGCTRNAWHLYMFRFSQEQFAGLSRAKFLKALAAEGIPASAGYSPLNKEPFLQNTFASRGWQRLFGDRRLRDWAESNMCPANDQLCTEAVWLTQTMLLGKRTDMEQIAAAVRKIQSHAAELSRA